MFKLMVIALVAIGVAYACDDDCNCCCCNCQKSKPKPVVKPAPKPAPKPVPKPVQKKAAPTQYVIRSSYGKVLDISRTKPKDAIIYGFHGGSNQRFTITRDGPNSIVRCVQDNEVVEANPKGQVDSKPFNNTPNEKWRIKKVSSPLNPNLYMFINAADGKCLDLFESRNTNDIDVINYPCHGLPNQLWQIIPIVPGQKVLPTNYTPYRP